MSDIKSRIAQTVTEMDADELAVRMIEIGCKMRRPFGATGRQAMQEFRRSADAGLIPSYIIKDFEDMAVAAIKYLAECVSKSGTMQ